MIDFKPYILLFPSIKRLLADPYLADQIRHRPSHLGLLQNANDLLHGNLLLRQNILLGFLPKTNIPTGSKLPGADQAGPEDARTMRDGSTRIFLGVLDFF